MPLTSDDLLYDTGEIRADWLDTPGITAAASLDKWLAQGYAHATGVGITDTEDRDAIARAHAYWRAYDSIAKRIAATPSSVNLQGDLSVSFSDKRASFFADEAARWKARYGAALNEAAADVSRVVSTPLSGRTLTHYVRF